MVYLWGCILLEGLVIVYMWRTLIGVTAEIRNHERRIDGHGNQIAGLTAKEARRIIAVREVWAISNNLISRDSNN